MMFQSAVLKLTAGYVLALLAICLMFSVPAYTVAMDRLERSAIRQGELLQRLPGRPLAEFATELAEIRNEQLIRDRQELLASIAVIDAAILVSGAALSYLFAKRTLEPLREAHEAQSRFTADASHELRTPLATMQTEVEVALRGGKLTPAQSRTVLSSILEEVARLRTLSDHLLALTRLDGNSLQKKPFNLSRALTEELAVLEQRHNITISTVLTKSVKCTGDAQLLRQVVSILVDNAVRYAGDKPPEVRVILSKSNNHAKITVQDSGRGIRPADMPHIFERFYRGSYANRHSPGGNGLGLSLAKAIIENHHGTIEAKSRAGKQTAFTVMLPL